MGSYATSAQVKERCRITQSDAQHDAELARAILYGDRFVTRYLAMFGLSVSDSDPEMSETASDYAAYYFLRTRNPDGAEKYRRDCLDWIGMYIFANTGAVVRSRGPPVPADLEISEI